MFLDRRPRRGEDPFLDWKVRLFFVGAALFGAAVFLDRPAFAIGAGVVLVVAFALRFLAPREEEPEYAEEEDAGEEPPPGRAPENGG